MAMDASSRPTDADEASLAFKAVAIAYMDSRDDASMLAAAATFMDVVALGAL